MSCPIEPDKAIRLNYGEGEDDYLLVAPSHDAIQMFPEAKFNHLRYYDTVERQLKAIWLAHHVLADLAELGIPMVSRESISESEYGAYERYLAQTSMDDEVEIEWIDEDDVEYLEDDGGIEAEVHDAIKNLDAELLYYLGETDGTT